MSPRDPLERSLVGPAGEHFVLYQLYRRGLLAALAPPGVPEVDIIVLDQHQVVRVGIQVKARTKGRDGGWHMRRKHQGLRSPQLYYAFVDFEPNIPITYIIPSAVVAQLLEASHRAWLGALGARGQPHRDHDMRRVQPMYPHPWPGYASNWLEKYRDDWAQLADPSS